MSVKKGIRKLSPNSLASRPILLVDVRDTAAREAVETG
jgi:hypothetical protein